MKEATVGALIAVILGFLYAFALAVVTSLELDDLVFVGIITNFIAMSLFGVIPAVVLGALSGG